MHNSIPLYPQTCSIATIQPQLTTPTALSATLPYHPTRSLSLKSLTTGLKQPREPNYENPVMAKLLTKKAREEEVAKKPTLPDMPFREGALSKETTIFKPDYEIPGLASAKTEAEREAVLARQEALKQSIKEAKDKRLSALKLDPDPRARILWERRQVIKGVRGRGRMTKDQKLKREERSLMWQSKQVPGSVKKLTRIMHLIAGKTVEEAMVQLRFNPKRAARDVIRGLQIARDEAIVARGMGLGSVKSRPSGSKVKTVKSGTVEENMSKRQKIKAAKNEVQLRLQEERLLSAGTFRKPKPTPETAVKIELKDGKHKLVDDPTEIYIDQAWVGKGEEWKEPEYRAKGRVNMLTHRTTSK